MLYYMQRFLDEGSNIDKEDLERIAPLSKKDALLFGDSFFPGFAREALLVGRSYGEPKMSLIFDEGDIDKGDMIKKLKSMNADNTEIHFFWDIYSAVKTTWGLFVKHWDIFCESGDESIIYVNPDEIYLYHDMLLKKINQKASTGDDVFEGLPEDIKDDLYLIFHSICEGAQTIKDEGLRKEYIEYYKYMTSSHLKDVIIICKPYVSNDRNLADFLIDGNEFNKSRLDSFYAQLGKYVKS